MRYTFKNLDMHINGTEWNKNSSKEILQYAVGALLYTPANHKNVSEYIINKRFPQLKSIVLCLEDSIIDNFLENAENTLFATLEKIYFALIDEKIYINELPLIFIRVRTSEQLKRIYEKIFAFKDILSGFCIPKLSETNADEYKEIIKNINSDSKKLFFMPIIESASVINLKNRINNLYFIKDSLDEIKEYILNIRVGGNDFCNVFGVRRNVLSCIYDIGIVNSILIDIVNVFGMDYVVSGPVFEYFGDLSSSKEWIEGLKREIELDKLNGFLGKTVIHPSQISVVTEMMVQSFEDYTDALSILEWKNAESAVEKGAFSGRMNEVKVHKLWAEKVMLLSKIYGVKNITND